MVEEQLCEEHERGIRRSVAGEGSSTRGPGATVIRGPVTRQGPRQWCVPLSVIDLSINFLLMFTCIHVRACRRFHGF